MSPNKCYSKEIKNKHSQVWLFMSVIPVFRRLKQEDNQFWACLEYIAKTCFKTKQNTNKQTKDTLHTEQQK